MLAATAREAGAPLPILLPPRRRLALRPPRPLLRARADPRGVPPALCAEGAADCRRGREGRTRPARARRVQPEDEQRRSEEGGPRNGVMTAVEDFIAEHEGDAPAPRAADLLRPRDRRRRRSGSRVAASSATRSSGSMTPVPARAARAVRAASDQGDALGAGGLLPLAGQARRDGASATSTLLRANLDDRPEALDHLMACLDTIRRGEGRRATSSTAASPGADAAVLMRGLRGRRIRWGDRVCGSPATVRGAHVAETYGPASRRFELLDERVKIHPGAPSERSSTRRRSRGWRCVRVGADAAARTELWRSSTTRSAVGGFVLVEDCNAPERREAIESFRAERGIGEPLEPADRRGACGWRKLG